MSVTQSNDSPVYSPSLPTSLGDTVHTPLSTSQPTSNAGYSNSLTATYPEQTSVSPTTCTKERVAPLENLGVTRCTSPLKADVPCTTDLTVLQPASQAHTRAHHSHKSTHVHAPAHVHSSPHTYIPMNDPVAAMSEPTCTILPPITHYSGTASIASMTDCYTYTSPYTQYPSTYPAYGYGTGGLLNMGSHGSSGNDGNNSNGGNANSSSSSSSSNTDSSGANTNNSSNLSNAGAHPRTLQSARGSSSCLRQDLGT
ncbi:uncharacterized protein [Panulirus ornatus]|uniref:uncharacterized protein n=1 Tax=Panulirus ornatus TaxID=150431 RepID=UPI003A8C76C3